MKAGTRFFLFLFFSFHLSIAFFFLIFYFHPFVAYFSLELCSHFLFFYCYASLSFSLALLQEFFFGFASTVNVFLWLHFNRFLWLCFNKFFGFASLLQVLFASCSRQSFLLLLYWEIMSLELPSKEIVNENFGFPRISWKLPHGLWHTL